MTLFRAFLVTVLIVVTGYTLVVIASQGIDFLPVFFGDIARMQWPGQFNLDFLFLLLLSGLWVAWRHEFSPVGLLLGLAPILGGVVFLSAYLLVASFRAKGDVRIMLLGAARASR